jgi:hypothetical protein
LNLKNLEGLSVLWLASPPLRFIYLFINFARKRKKEEIVFKTCKFYLNFFFFRNKINQLCHFPFFYLIFFLRKNFYIWFVIL